ncbi:MAG: nitroreductase family protein [Thermodesulfobacteriota bacterium]|nr:nitroreductase family protein [Thermodesulfobacteriota bacterium]
MNKLKISAVLFALPPLVIMFAVLRPGWIVKILAKRSPDAPLNILITAEYDRITSKYGKRGVRYAIIEAGHIGQNILLQSEAMGLGAGIVGAFNDEKVRQVVNIPPNHEPLLILPVGYKTEGL